MFMISKGMFLAVIINIQRKSSQKLKSENLTSNTILTVLNQQLEPYLPPIDQYLLRNCRNMEREGVLGTSKNRQRKLIAVKAKTMGMQGKTIALTMLAVENSWVSTSRLISISFPHSLQIKSKMHFPYFPFYGANMLPLQMTFFAPYPQAMYPSTSFQTVPLTPESLGNQNASISLNTSTNLAQTPVQEESGRSLRRRVQSRRQSDETFGWRNQNKDRNIVSNILKAFAHYLSDEVGMRRFLEEVYERLGLQSDVSEFYRFVRDHFPENQSYISPKYVRSFLRDPTKSQSLRVVFKLALNRFYRMDFMLVLLKSTKMKTKSKFDQMQKGRELLRRLFSS